MLNCLFFSVMFNESEEMFKIVVLLLFCDKKNILASSSFSNFPVKLIYWGILMFVYLGKSLPMSL